MKYFEFGKENEELMVLLHGGGTSYLGVLPTAKKIAEKYHVILLAYDGFNPSEPESEFRSVAWEARELEDYILQNYGGRVDILSCPYHELAKQLGDEKAVLCICHMDKEYSQGFRHIRYDRNSAVSEGAGACEYRLRFDPEKD